ncbi:hypothetical protein CEXT_543991 [Caerostris extrusa]|uniref:Uncharacterized protein n=1 Tax=Caerostris extrusa TaxID=172846 RepID=A0AAV4SLV1_CAEEX|nr:hypothetical protein CEXT_543991 [Caerostris extrusa]
MELLRDEKQKNVYHYIISRSSTPKESFPLNVLFLSKSALFKNKRQNFVNICRALGSKRFTVCKRILAKSGAIDAQSLPARVGSFLFDSTSETCPLPFKPLFFRQEGIKSRSS